MELTLLGLWGDLATSKSINDGQEARGKEDGSSIQKSQWHHQPLLPAISRDPGPPGRKTLTLTATEQIALPWPAGPRPELTAQTESLSHLPLPGTSCTTGPKPGCFDSGTTSIDQGAPGCYVASEGNCGALPGLCAM